MTKEQKQEFTFRITQANKTGLIVILYEMVLVYIEEAQNAGKENNKEQYKESISKIRGCVNELVASLHLEYELGRNLMQLYLYINRELVKAERSEDTIHLDHIKGIIEKLHASYVELAKKDTSKAIMDNVENVYAGLTYSKNTLSENLVNQSTNRGFMV